MKFVLLFDSDAVIHGCTQGGLALPYRSHMTEGFSFEFKRGKKEEGLFYVDV